MSLPHSLRTSVTPPELELIACQDLIEIVPLIPMEKTAFISGAYGPLRPPRKAKIPIWMAVNLKMKRKCHIVAPSWLSVEILQTRLEEEKASPHFSELPFRYMEISKVLLDVAADDIENSDKIRSLLKDLREARQAKSRAGLGSLDSFVLMSNLCAMEINEIRPVWIQSSWILEKLQHKGDEPSSTREEDF
ncbi:DNA replication complex GINS protein PSF2 [Mycena floridula]|nr:DNA replication complex GINS protein PSF2 [Mycena floridula]